VSEAVTQGMAEKLKENSRRNEGLIGILTMTTEAELVLRYEP
jgi:hypothetical protein